MIHYRKGYKYQLAKDYYRQTDLRPKEDIITQFIRLSTDGVLLIKSGYAWDGPSGPTIDTKNFMEGSLVHDALYQLMRMDWLPQSARKYADKLLVEICRENGMSKLRCCWVYKGVRGGAGFAASPENKKKVIIAP